MYAYTQYHCLFFPCAVAESIPRLKRKVGRVLTIQVLAVNDHSLNSLCSSKSVGCICQTPNACVCVLLLPLPPYQLLSTHDSPYRACRPA